MTPTGYDARKRYAARDHTVREAADPQRVCHSAGPDGIMLFDAGNAYAWIKSDLTCATYVGREAA